jgi:acetyl esterase/lipase
MKVLRSVLALGILLTVVLIPAPPAQAGACDPPTIPPTWDNVTFKTLPDGTDVTVDIFLPSGNGPFPALVTIHGSLWKSGCKENVEKEADIARDDGFAVFNIDTRLDCKRPPPGIDPGLCGYRAIDPAVDAGDAVAWVRAHAADYKADPNHVGTFGFSTGGNLAFMTTVMGVPGGNRADAAVAWSATTELGYLEDGRVSCTLSSSPTSCTNSRMRYIGCTLATCPRAWAKASPYDHLDSADAPMFIANSFYELVPYQEAVDLYDLASQLGVPATLCSAPSGHARDYEDMLCAENGSQTVIEWTLSWLHDQLG